MSESASSSSFVPSRPSASRRLSRSPAPLDMLDMLAWTPQVERGADMVGVVLGGRFVVTGRIGRGGMSWVFACEDRLLRGKAAVKVLRTPEAGARRRFLAEARVLARVRHPRLVQVLAVGEMEDRGPFMAMECLEGPSLEDRLRSGPLGWREAVEVGIQVADALATLHAAGVIHRDVKPSNLVQVPSATGRISVKVIDLGVAKVQGGSPVIGGGSCSREVWRTTEAGIAVGTRGYCAPEAGLCEADARLDVYGLGVTLFQLCTGALPRRGERWRRMDEVRPETAFPAGLEALVEAMVASDPEVRVGSMVEVVRRLEAVAGAGATADVMDDTEGLFAGRYEVLEPLGLGAFAEVVRAYDREAERYVALKRLRAGAAATEEGRRRLVVEARALGAVRDAALPELYECRTGARGGVPFVAMSVARGQAASEFCLAGRTLKIAEAIAVGRQVAGALAVLHARGIVHRDVNAGNVIVERGVETRAMLVDLGMAELSEKFYAVAELRYPTPPERRVSLGTGGLERLGWTAPEARTGAGWTGKSDVFSLGVLLFRVLTGKVPFVEEEARARSVREWLPRCPETLAGAIAWALEVEPERRCEARELVEALEDAAAEVEAIERGAAGEPGPMAERRAAMLVEERVRRERLQWRVVLGIVMATLTYLGFVVGLVVGEG